MATNYQTPNRNLNKPKETVEKPKFEKIVTGNVAPRKKGIVSRFKDILFAEDIGNVKNRIWSDVIVPAAKKMLTDAVRDGVDMLVYGTKGVRTSSSNRSGIPMVEYNKRYGNTPTLQSNNGFSFDDLSFARRSDAEDVLAVMRSAVVEYGMVSVADMYDMAGRTAPFTSNNYGWMGTSLDNAEIVRTYDGQFVIRLPKAINIDRG